SPPLTGARALPPSMRSASRISRAARMGESVHIREVGPRDGLQLVGTVLPTEKKLEWCRRARDAGIGEIEVTSFVRPTVVPQFADAPEVARGAVALGGFVAAALVPNLKGAERALE